jgi:UDP-N-acetylmuramyl pentapeptide phosphotransferase/UDP-N-acetylglucosamine-1-phosphate transferase
MTYIIIAIILFIILNGYFYLANKHNIIDNPTQRSSHSEETISGGGIIFYFGILIYFILAEFHFPYFFIGLTLITSISFIDDLRTLSYYPRLVIQFVSTLIMFYDLNILFTFNPIFIFILLFLVVGTINLYNFMDGINGMLSGISLFSFISLFFINRYITHFIDETYLCITIIALLIFSFYNFKEKAKSFAGDVGSISIAFILIYAVAKLILTSRNPVYLFLFSITYIEAGLTVAQRLFIRKENIFKPHRIHLFQILCNEYEFKHLHVSLIYAALQLILGSLLFFISYPTLNLSISLQLGIAFSFSIILAILYISIKCRLMKKT